MTRLVDGLYQRGWVERDRDKEDRRRVQVSLTDVGRAEAQELRDRTRLAFEPILAQIPRDKRAQVVESMGLLRAAMEATQGSQADCCKPGRTPSQGSCEDRQ